MCCPTQFFISSQLSDMDDIYNKEEQQIDIDIGVNDENEEVYNEGNESSAGSYFRKIY